MTINIPYAMIKNIEQNKKLVIDYSNNPCPNELSDFLKCVTNKPYIASYYCKDKYINYIECIKKYNLILP